MLESAKPAKAVSGCLRTDPGETLTDVDGRVLCMRTLCREHLVLVCTFKSVSCPVCPQQLQRVLQEPIRSLCREAMVKFIVLCPGPLWALRELRDTLHLKEDVPFVCDAGLDIAQSVNATLKAGQIMPCFFELKPDLSIGWTQIGRGPNNFGDDKVREFLTRCLNETWEQAERTYCELQLVVVSLRSSQQLEASSQSPLPSPLMQGTFEFLDAAAGKIAASSSREMYALFRSYGLGVADACLAEADSLRSGPRVDRATCQLREGRGHLLQRVQISGGRWHSCHGTIRQSCQEGKYMVLVYSSMGLQNLNAAELEAIPWYGVSIPKLEEIRERLVGHIGLLSRPIQLADSVRPSTAPRPASPLRQWAMGRLCLAMLLGISACLICLHKF